MTNDPYSPVQLLVLQKDLDYPGLDLIDYPMSGTCKLLDHCSCYKLTFFC